MCKQPIGYCIRFMFFLELLVNLCTNFLFALKFYNIHKGNYIYAYSVCFVVYAVFYYIGLLPYVMIGISEENHMIFFSSLGYNRKR